jgi:hypothetical protein
VPFLLKSAALYAVQLGRFAAACSHAMFFTESLAVLNITYYQAKIIMKASATLFTNYSLIIIRQCRYSVVNAVSNVHHS